MFPYVGILAGYSMMKWKNYPIDSITTIDSSSSIFGGVQVGSELPIYGGISMYLFYRYLIMDFTTNIRTNTATKELKYNMEQNINIGIKYNFKYNNDAITTENPQYSYYILVKPNSFAKYSPV